MRSFAILAPAILAAATCSISLPGCSSATRASASSGTSTQNPASVAVADPAAAPAADKASADEARKKEDERARKRAKLERDAQIARLKLGQARTGSQNSEAQQQSAMTKANADLELSTRKLANFKEQTAPTRVARGELSLQRSQDGVKEAEEELAQLEMMYKDEQFAGQTKEIVLERGRRRLNRSRRDLEIQQTEFATLKEKTLPVEVGELELQVQDKQREIDRLKREAEATRIDKQIGILSAEAEVARLDQELSDLEKEARPEQSHAAAARETP
ncbi:MAG TPA: hypothetical protein VGM03_12845 [Phycisphaerae bacterium]|jgi:hypothetical protein